MTQPDAVVVIDKAGAAATLAVARRCLRDRQRENREALKKAQTEVHKALNLRKMVEALDTHEIPTEHRPRLMHEMSALGTAANYEKHVSDYKTAFIDTDGGAKC